MRLIFLLFFLICTALLGYAQYLQHVQGLLPCPLCVAQRVAYWLVGLSAFVAYWHNPGTLGIRLYGVLIMFFALLGSIIAARHAWLIRYPDSFECGISPEEAFLNSLPIASWWPGMFEANGDCSTIEWRLLNLTIPDWSLLMFIAITATGLYLILNNRKTKHK
ncbi:MAG: disulfide bond formation protein B [Nitrosomonas sp.]